ncbi:MAG: HAMP domain-containing protein [Oscillatoria sp. SIO1A7]|nr:HAMP domain-containing protein [Oscillatoria sp. SIO1A7]
MSLKIPTNALRKVSQKIPLRLLLVVPFVLQIFAAVGLTGWLSMRNGRQAIDDLAFQLSSQATARIDRHVQNYLAKPHLFNQMFESAVRSGDLNLEDFIALENFFWHQIQQADLGTSFFASNPQGDFLGIRRDVTGSTTLMIRDESTEPNWEIHRLNSSGDRSSLIVRKEYDPRDRPWYKAVIKSRTSTWSPILQVASRPVLAIIAVRPIYDKTDNLTAILGGTITLSQLSEFLRNLNISPSGQAFIIERSGEIVASSGREPPLVSTSEGEERLLATSSRELFINSTSRQILQRFGSYARVTEESQFAFTLDGKLQLVQVRPLQDELGLDWLSVVVIPEEDFMERINANTRITIGLCMTALVLATLVGIETSRRIGEPILRLSEAARAMSSGKLNQKVELSDVKELRVLARSFNQMARQLRESFTALEKTNEELETRVEQRTQELQDKNIDLHKALEQLKRTQAQLIQAEKMSGLGQLVAGIAHEINNPVSFIYGNVDYARDYIQDLLGLIEVYQQEYPNPSPNVLEAVEETDLEFVVDDLEKLLSSMKSGADRIRNIVLSLRNFSRLDESDMKPVDIHQGLESTLLVLQKRLGEQKSRPAIEIIKEYGQLPEVTCYASKLNQVFMNILNNAIDAIEKGNGEWGMGNGGRKQGAEGQGAGETRGAETREVGDKKIEGLGGLGDREEKNAQVKALKLITENSPQYPMPTIAIATEVTDDDSVIIRIADNGLGMQEDVLQKIFDPFFTTKPVGSGTGLGLSISYQIVVESHGGKLSCVSSPGAGAEFMIEIPIAAAKS